jgi:hypothetical protein
VGGRGTQRQPGNPAHQYRPTRPLGQLRPYALGNILRGARLMEKEALVKRAAAQSGR